MYLIREKLYRNGLSSLADFPSKSWHKLFCSKYPILVLFQNTSTRPKVYLGSKVVSNNVNNLISVFFGFPLFLIGITKDFYHKI